jgi:hypothetical protein
MSKLDFHRKKSSVLPELRPLYKIVSILLILKICCTGNKSSLLKLHLFNWALLDNNRILKLIKSAEINELIVGVWGIDPSLNMALNYAVAEKLVIKLDNGAYKLTDRGGEFLERGDVLSSFHMKSSSLISITKKISEKMVAESARRWANEI